MKRFVSKFILSIGILGIGVFALFPVMQGFSQNANYVNPYTDINDRLQLKYGPDGYFSEMGAKENNQCPQYDANTYTTSDLEHFVPTEHTVFNEATGKDEIRTTYDISSKETGVINYNGTASFDNADEFIGNEAKNVKSGDRIMFGKGSNNPKDSDFDSSRPHKVLQNEGSIVGGSENDSTNPQWRVLAVGCIPSYETEASSTHHNMRSATTPVGNHEVLLVTDNVMMFKDSDSNSIQPAAVNFSIPEDPDKIYNDEQSSTNYKVDNNINTLEAYIPQSLNNGFEAYDCYSVGQCSHATNSWDQNTFPALSSFFDSTGPKVGSDYQNFGADYSTGGLNSTKYFSETELEAPADSYWTGVCQGETAANYQKFIEDMLAESNDLTSRNDKNTVNYYTGCAMGREGSTSDQSNSLEDVGWDNGLTGANKVNIKPANDDTYALNENGLGITTKTHKFMPLSLADIAGLPDNLKANPISGNTSIGRYFFGQGITGSNGVSYPTALRSGSDFAPQGQNVQYGLNYFNDSPSSQTTNAAGLPPLAIRPTFKLDLDKVILSESDADTHKIQNYPDGTPNIDFADTYRLTIVKSNSTGFSFSFNGSNYDNSSHNDQSSKEIISSQLDPTNPGMLQLTGINFPSGFNRIGYKFVDTSDGQVQSYGVLDVAGNATDVPVTAKDTNLDLYIWGQKDGKCVDTSDTLGCSNEATLPVVFNISSKSQKFKPCDTYFNVTDASANPVTIGDIGDGSEAVMCEEGGTLVFGTNTKGKEYNLTSTGNNHAIRVESGGSTTLNFTNDTEISPKLEGNGTIADNNVVEMNRAGIYVKGGGTNLNINVAKGKTLTVNATPLSSGDLCKVAVDTSNAISQDGGVCSNNGSKSSAMMITGSFFPVGAAGIQVMSDASVSISAEADIDQTGAITNRGKVIAKGAKGGAGIGLPGTFYSNANASQSIPYNYVIDTESNISGLRAQMIRSSKYYPSYAKDMDVMLNNLQQQKVSVAKAGNISISGSVEVEAVGANFGIVNDGDGDVNGNKTYVNGILTDYGASAAGIGGGACFNTIVYDDKMLKIRKSGLKLLDGQSFPNADYDGNDIPYFEMPFSGSHSNINISGTALVKAYSGKNNLKATLSATGAGIGTGGAYMCNAPTITNDKYGNKDASATTNGSREYSGELGSIRPFGQIGPQIIVGAINILDNANVDAASNAGFATGAGIGGGSVILDQSSAQNADQNGNGPHRMLYAGDAGTINISSAGTITATSGSGNYVGAGIGGGSIKSDIPEHDSQISSYDAPSNTDANGYTLSYLSAKYSSRFAGISALLNISGNDAPNVIAASGGNRAVAIGSGITNSIGDDNPKTLGFYNKLNMSNGSVTAIGDLDNNDTYAVGGGKLIISSLVNGVKAVGGADLYKPIQITGGSFYPIAKNSSGQNTVPRVSFADPSLYDNTSFAMYPNDVSAGCDSKIDGSNYNNLRECVNDIHSNVYNNSDLVNINAIRWLSRDSSGSITNPNDNNKYKNPDQFFYSGYLQTGCPSPSDYLSNKASNQNYVCPLYNYVNVNSVRSLPISATSLSLANYTDFIDTNGSLLKTYSYKTSSGSSYNQYIFPWLANYLDISAPTYGIQGFNKSNAAAINPTTTFGPNHNELNDAKEIKLWEDISRIAFSGGLKMTTTFQDNNFHDNKPRYNQKMTLKARVGGALVYGQNGDGASRDANTYANIIAMNADGRNSYYGACDNIPADASKKQECSDNGGKWDDAVDNVPEWECKFFLADNASGVGATQIPLSKTNYYDPQKVRPANSSILPNTYDCSSFGKFNAWANQSDFETEQAYFNLSGIDFTPSADDVDEYLQLQITLRSSRHFDRTFVMTWDGASNGTWIKIENGQLGQPYFEGNRFTDDSGQARDIVERNVCDMSPKQAPFGTLQASPNEWEARNWTGTAIPKPGTTNGGNNNNNNFTYNDNSYVDKQVCTPFGNLKLAPKDGDAYASQLDLYKTFANGGNADIEWKRMEKDQYKSFVTSGTLDQMSGYGNPITTNDAAFDKNGWLIRPTNSFADSYIQATITLKVSGYEPEILHTQWIRIYSYSSLHDDKTTDNIRYDDEGWYRGCKKSDTKPINNVIAIGGGCDNNGEGHNNLHSPSAPNYYWVGGGKYTWPDNFGMNITGGNDGRGQADNKIRFGETVALSPAKVGNTQVNIDTNKYIDILKAEVKTYSNTKYTCQWRYAIATEGNKPTINPSASSPSIDPYILSPSSPAYDLFPEGDGAFNGSGDIVQNTKCSLDDNGFNVSPIMLSPLDQATYGSTPIKYAWVALVISFSSELYIDKTVTALNWTSIQPGKIKSPKFKFNAKDITADNSTAGTSGMPGQGFDAKCNIQPSDSRPNIVRVTQASGINTWENICTPFGVIENDTNGNTNGFEDYNSDVAYISSNPQPNQQGVTKTVDYKFIASPTSTSGMSAWNVGSLADSSAYVNASSTGSPGNPANKWIISPKPTLADKYIIVRFGVSKPGYEPVYAYSGWIRVYSQASLNTKDTEDYYTGCQATLNDHQDSKLKALDSFSDGDNRSRLLAIGGGCKNTHNGSSTIQTDVENLGNSNSPNYYWPYGGPTSLPPGPLIGKVLATTDPNGVASDSRSNQIRYGQTLNIGLWSSYSAGDPAQYQASKTLFDALKKAVVDDSKGNIICEWSYASSQTPALPSGATKIDKNEPKFQTFVDASGNNNGSNCNGLLSGKSLKIDPKYFPSLSSSKYVSLEVQFVPNDDSILARQSRVFGWGGVELPTGETGKWAKVEKGQIGVGSFDVVAENIVLGNYCDTSISQTAVHQVPVWDQNYSQIFDTSKQVCIPFGGLKASLLSGGGTYVANSLTSAQEADETSFTASLDGWYYSESDTKPALSEQGTIMRQTATGGTQQDIAVDSLWKLTPRAAFTGKWIRPTFTLKKGSNYDALSFKLGDWIRVYSPLDFQYNTSNNTQPTNYYFGCANPVSSTPRDDGRINVGGAIINSSIGALGGGCDSNNNGYENQHDPNSPNYYWTYGGKYNYFNNLDIKKTDSDYTTTNTTNNTIGSPSYYTVDMVASVTSGTTSQINTYKNIKTQGNIFTCKWVVVLANGSEDEIPSSASSNYPINDTDCQNAFTNSQITFTPRPQEADRDIKLIVTLTNQNKITHTTTTTSNLIDTYNSKTITVLTTHVYKAKLGKVDVSPNASNIVAGRQCDATPEKLKTSSDLCNPFGKITLSDHPNWEYGKDFDIIVSGSYSSNIEDQKGNIVTSTPLGWGYTMNNNNPGFTVNPISITNILSGAPAGIVDSQNPFKVTPSQNLADQHIRFTFVVVKDGYESTLFRSDWIDVINLNSLLENGSQQYKGCDLVPHLANDAKITYSGTPAVTTPTAVESLATNVLDVVRNDWEAGGNNRAKITIVEIGSALGAACDDDGDSIPNAHDPGPKRPQFDWPGGGLYNFPATFTAEITSSGVGNLMGGVPTIDQPLTIKVDNASSNLTSAQRTDIGLYQQTLSKSGSGSLPMLGETNPPYSIPIDFTILNNVNPTDVECHWYKSTVIPTVGVTEATILANSTEIDASDSVFKRDCYSDLISAAGMTVNFSASQWLNNANGNGYTLGLRLLWKNDLFNEKDVQTLNWINVKKASLFTPGGQTPVISLSTTAKDIVYSTYRKDGSTGEWCNLTPGFASEKWEEPSNVNDSNYADFVGSEESFGTKSGSKKQICTPFGALNFDTAYTGPKDINTPNGLQVEADWQVAQTSIPAYQVYSKHHQNPQNPNNEGPLYNTSFSPSGTSNNILSFKDSQKLVIKPGSSLRGGWMRARFRVTAAGYDTVTLVSPWIYVYDFNDLNGIDNNGSRIDDYLFYEGCNPTDPDIGTYFSKGNKWGESVVGEGLGGGCKLPSSQLTTSTGQNNMNIYDYNAPNFWWIGAGPAKSDLGEFKAVADPDHLLFGSQTTIKPDTSNPDVLDTIAEWNIAPGDVMCQWQQNLLDPSSATSTQWDAAWQNVNIAYTVDPQTGVSRGYDVDKCSNLVSSNSQLRSEGLKASPTQAQITSQILPTMRLLISFTNSTKFNAVNDIVLWEKRVEKGSFGAGNFTKQVQNLIQGASCNTSPTNNPPSLPWSRDPLTSQTSGQICTEFGSIKLGNFVGTYEEMNAYYQNTMNLESYNASVQWYTSNSQSISNGSGHILSSTGYHKDYFDFSGSNPTNPTAWNLTPTPDAGEQNIYVQAVITVNALGYNQAKIYSQWIPILDYSINTPGSPNYNYGCDIHRPIPNNALIMFNYHSDVLEERIGELTNEHKAYLDQADPNDNSKTNWDSITVVSPGFALGGGCDDNGDGDPNKNDDDHPDYYIPGGGPYTFANGYQVLVDHGVNDYGSNDLNIMPRYDQTIVLKANFNDAYTEENVVTSTVDHHMEYICKFEMSNDSNFATGNVIPQNDSLVEVDYSKCADLANPQKGLPVKITWPNDNNDNRFIRLVLTIHDPSSRYADYTDIVPWTQNATSNGGNSVYGWQKIQKGIFGSFSFTDADDLVQQQLCNTYPGSQRSIFTNPGDSFCKPFGPLQFNNGFGSTYGSPITANDYYDVTWYYTPNVPASNSVATNSTQLTVMSNPFEIIPLDSLVGNYVQARFALKRNNYVNTAVQSSGWMKVYGYADVNDPNGDDYHKGCNPPDLTPTDDGFALGGGCNTDADAEINIDDPDSPNNFWPKGDDASQLLFPSSFRLKVTNQLKSVLYLNDSLLHIDDTLTVAADDDISNNPTNDQISTHNALQIPDLNIQCRIDTGRDTSGSLQITIGSWQNCLNSQSNIADDSIGFSISPQVSDKNSYKRVLIKLSAPGYADKIYGDDNRFSDEGWGDWQSVELAQFGPVTFTKIASDIVETVECDSTPGREKQIPTDGTIHNETCSPFGYLDAPYYPSLYNSNTPKVIDPSVSLDVVWKYTTNTANTINNAGSNLSPNFGTVNANNPFIISVKEFSARSYVLPKVTLVKDGYIPEVVDVSYDGNGNNGRANWIKVWKKLELVNPNNPSSWTEGCDVHPEIPNDSIVHIPALDDSNGASIPEGDYYIYELSLMRPSLFALIDWDNITVVRRGTAIGGGCDDDGDGIPNKNDPDSPTDGYNPVEVKTDFDATFKVILKRQDAPYSEKPDLYVDNYAYLAADVTDSNTKKNIDKMAKAAAESKNPVWKCEWYSTNIVINTAVGGGTIINDPVRYPTDSASCAKLVDQSATGGIKIHPDVAHKYIRLKLTLSADGHNTKVFEKVLSFGGGGAKNPGWAQIKQKSVVLKYKSEPKYFVEGELCDSTPGRNKPASEVYCNVFGQILMSDDVSTNVALKYGSDYTIADYSWTIADNDKAANGSGKLVNDFGDGEGTDGSYNEYKLQVKHHDGKMYVQIKVDLKDIANTQNAVIEPLYSQWIRVYSISDLNNGGDGEFAGCESDHTKPGAGKGCNQTTTTKPPATVTKPPAPKPPVVAITCKKDEYMVNKKCVKKSAPAAVSSIKITLFNKQETQQGTDVKVDWNIPSANGSPITKFLITMRDSFGELWPKPNYQKGFVDQIQLPPTQKTWTYQGAQVGKYVVTVEACNAIGCTSAEASDIVTLFEQTDSQLKKKGIAFKDLAKTKKTAKERYNDIIWMARTNVTIGDGCVDNNSKTKCVYMPTNPVTRAAMGDFMYKLLGQPDRGDLSAQEKWFKKDKATKKLKNTVQGGIKNWRFRNVLWLAKKGITKGCAYDAKGIPSSFCPSNPVVRGAMAEFMYHLANDPQSMNRLFADENNITENHIDWNDRKVLSAKFANFFKKDKKVRAHKTAAPTRYGDIHWLASLGVTLGNVKPGTAIPTGIYNTGGVTNRGAMAQFMHKLYWSILTGKPVPADNMIPDNNTIRKCAVDNICPVLTK